MDRKSATTRSDVWSLASTLLELFQEEPVWNLDCSLPVGSQTNDAYDLLSILRARMKKKDKPDGLANLVSNTDIPPRITEIIVEGLNYDHSMRPSSMAVLAVLKTD